MPEFTVPVIGALPKLDGRLEDLCWKQALASTSFYPSGKLTSADSPSSGTELRLGQRGRWLLAAVDCRATAAGAPQESVSVFLDPLHSHEFAYVFTVQANGETRQDTWADPWWVQAKGHWEAAVATSADGWSAELRIDLMHLPYLRSHTETVGLFVSRKLADKSRLIWALNDTQKGLMESGEGWESFWACHVRGLDVPGIIAQMDKENQAFCAPLMPRVAALRERAGRLLRDASLPPERRIKALSLAIWVEDLDPARRHYVERVSLRGLAEREEYLRDAETLAAIVEGREPRVDARSALARLAADPAGPAFWEIDVARPIARFLGRTYALSVSFAGLPLARIHEERRLTAEEVAKEHAEMDRSEAEEGFEVRHQQRGEFDCCLRRRPGGTEAPAYATSGSSIYRFPGSAPGANQVMVEALFAAEPVRPVLAERLLNRWQAPVKVEGVQRLLAVPLTGAAFVVAPSLESDDPALVRLLWRMLGDLKAISAQLPGEGTAVVLGTAEHDESLRAAGFDVGEWPRGSAAGRVAVRAEGGRTLVGLWGRDGAGLARAALVLRDLRSLLGKRALLIGDLHAHSVLSDGSGSPRQVLLAAMAAGLDFMAITDHSMVEGAVQAKAWCDAQGLDLTVIRGEEVLGAGFEVLALGIEEWVRPQADPKQIATEIHRQGGLALLCHVGYPDEDTGKRLMAEFDSLGLDGIDRQSQLMVDYLNEQELVSRRPVVTAVTDAHELLFGQTDRTLVFAQDRSEQGILDAIQRGYYLTLSSYGIMGAPRLVEVMLALIDEREYLSQRYHERLEERLGALTTESRESW